MSNKISSSYDQRTMSAIATAVMVESDNPYNGCELRVRVNNKTVLLLPYEHLYDMLTEAVRKVRLGSDQSPSLERKISNILRMMEDEYHRSLEES